MTTVINLIGGPSVGKSTLAALLYARMKASGFDVELVREVAKDWAHEGRKIGPFEQIAILGEQIKRESSLFDKVDYIVTDSPVVLGAFYFYYNYKQVFMSRMVYDYYKFSRSKNINFINILLPRVGEYENKGRFETEEQARDIDFALQDYLNFNDYEYVYCNWKDQDDIVKYIQGELNEE